VGDLATVLEDYDYDVVLEGLSEEDRREFLSLAEEVVEEEGKEKARKNHLHFMKYCWRKPLEDPFVVGFHTKRICERIDQAMEDFRNGKSTFIRIAVHNRAGKSDIVSRFLPPHFIGEFPWHHVIQASYSAEKAIPFARDGRSLLDSPLYKELYPNVKLSKKVSSAKDGKVFASGIHSGLTGSGGHLLILDDFISGRAEAESPTVRESTWNSFKDDFMTRRAPVSIVIILATQWHWDDVHGRIARKNDPEGEEYDPDFPKFEYMAFPARKELSDESDQYPGKFLFLERYSAQWYREQYATLGRYSSAAIMDCSPVRKGGNILNTENITIHPTEDDLPTDIRWYRVWDYAHTAKQRAKDDPDYTGGTLLGFRKKGYYQELKQWRWELWIRDYIQFRETATDRDKKIRDIAKQDGPGVKVLVEDSLDSMDGADYLKAQLMGIRTVIAVRVSGDKVTRTAPLEPIFEAGDVHLIRGAWNRIWIDGIERFDGSGKSHDEMIDNMTCGYKHICVGSGYGKLKNPYL